MEERRSYLTSSSGLRPAVVKRRVKRIEFKPFCISQPPTDYNRYILCVKGGNDTTYCRIVNEEFFDRNKKRADKSLPFMLKTDKK
jgi:hypothetical protein